ncbi:MAG: ABC transporter ATP-binding protein [Myxococcota bacterium]|nr:ABC transporter ATP-binding protein [Myxococcota bacterium]
MIEGKIFELTPLLPWLGLFAGIMLLSGGLQAIRGYFESVLGFDMDRVLSRRVLNHRLSLDMAFYEDPRNHNLLSRGSQFAGREYLKFILQVVNLGSLGIQFVTLLGVMMWILPTVTPLLAALAAPMILFRWRLSKLQYELNLVTTTQSRLRGYYANSLASKESLPTIKFFDLKDLLSERFDTLSRELLDVNRNLYRRRAVGQMAGSMAFAAAFLFAAGWAARSALIGELAIGSLVTYLASADRFRTSLNKLTKAASTVFTNLLFVRNLYDFFDAEPAIHPTEGSQLEEVDGRIRLENVSFRYPCASRDTLSGIDLEIEAGKTIAIVGGNGAGKTTLANLITRLFDPTGGAVFLDDVDVRKLSARWLYRQIAYVPQAPVRFETTAEENIAFGDFGRLEGRRDVVSRIATEAALDPVIAKMPDGLDTVLGKRFGDYDLSGGEWQRMAVARALAKRAPILVFDEPTANLDARSEYELFTALKEMTSDRTAIIISHRFATVRSADQIIVLEDGQIVEVGNHDELIELGQVYAGLYRVQQKALNG